MAQSKNFLVVALGAVGIVFLLALTQFELSGLALYLLPFLPAILMVAVFYRGAANDTSVYLRDNDPASNNRPSKAVLREARLVEETLLARRGEENALLTEARASRREQWGGWMERFHFVAAEVESTPELLLGSNRAVFESRKRKAEEALQGLDRRVAPTLKDQYELTFFRSLVSMEELTRQAKRRQAV